MDDTNEKCSQNEVNLDLVCTPLEISPMIVSKGWSLATLVGWSTCTWLLAFDWSLGWDDELATCCWSCTLPSLVLAWTWSWEPLELPFGTLPGKVQLPLQSPEMATNNHQLVPILHRCTKPSRWWKPPRATSEIHSKIRIPSASRCNHSNNALGFSPNLTMMMDQWWRWVGGLWLSSQGCYLNENGQECDLEPAIGLK